MEWVRTLIERSSRDTLAAHSPKPASADMGQTVVDLAGPHKTRGKFNMRTFCLNPKTKKRSSPLGACASRY